LGLHLLPRLRALVLDFFRPFSFDFSSLSKKGNFSMTGQTPAELAAAELQALKDSFATVTQNLAGLTAELAKRPAANPLEYLIGLPANPLGFPPGSNGTYPVIVTPRLHPHLLPDVIAQIGKFDFPPAHLGRLLKTFSATPPAGLILTLGPNNEMRLAPPTPVSGATALLRELPDILTFVEAWMIFTSVLQNEQPALPITQALTAHLNNIIVIARAYAWPAILDYHVAFMQARALDSFFSPMLWTKSDPHLHTMHLLAPSILAPSPAVSVPPASDRTRMASQICYMYNSASGCAGPPNCPRQHICRTCSGSHPQQQCATSNSASASA
jgi:hypothetical protein